MIAAELMTDEPTTVRADATVAEAFDVLRDAGVRHLPVLTAGGDLIGMLSDRDLALLATPSPQDEREGQRPRSMLPVSRVMSPTVSCVDPRSDVAEVIEKLLDNEIGAVAVVASGARLVGIISYIDVLRAFPRAVAEVAEQIEGRQAGRRPAWGPGA
ncbi:MAG: CBS domain-containing protein [Polyangiales bacterium]